MARSGGDKRAFDENGTYTRYLREIGRQPALTQEEESQLARRIRDGDSQALHALIRANLRFVISVSRNYLNQGLPLVDLINEGNIGLIRAARRFDERKNFKFISYAVWWIRQAILQALAGQSRVVTLPLNRVGVMHRVSKTQNRLEQRLRRAPATDEIAREMDLDEPVVRDSLGAGTGNVSLDAPPSGEKALPRAVELVSKVVTPDGAQMAISLHREVERALNSLSERERCVLQLYFGIGQETAYTLDDIGERLQLTRERVRQIKVHALRRLKHVSRSAGLSQFQGN